MKYWLISGIGIKAVRLPTALHKYGQWLEKNLFMGKVPKTGDGSSIAWKRISEEQYKACAHKW